MKIKALLNLTIIFLSVIFISCEDNLKYVGGDIQPDDDDISLWVDTVTLTARTISMHDSVYARTTTPQLGEYTDPIFGKVKSDYLCEFYCPENIDFPPGEVKIDSVFLNLAAYSFMGDSISPMGITVYEVTQPLTANFFTNVNPLKYSDMTKVLGQSVFSIQDAPYVNEAKLISTPLKLSLGQRFYDEWVRNSGTFKNSNTLRDFFKGMYVTTTYGSSSLLNVSYTIFEIYYAYEGRNAANTEDSTRVGLFRLPVTSDVIQLNRIKNTGLEGLLAESDTRAYLRTPAGVCTEITIPLNNIMTKTGGGQIINAANFKLKGFTEEEEGSTLGRPTNLLFINRDSLPNFFLKRNKPDSKTSFIVGRTASTNIYDFGNVANAINYYANYYKNAAVIPDLKYLVIPIDVELEQNTSTGAYTVVNVFNLMKPTSAILRTDEKNMKMGLTYSRYNQSN